MTRFASLSLPPARIKESYEAAIKVVESSGTVTYAVSEGQLPPHLVMDAAGWIRGIPQADGIYGFTVSVSDAQGTISQDFEIQVFASLQVPAPSSAGKRIDPASGAMHLDNGHQTYISALMCLAIAGASGLSGAAAAGAAGAGGSGSTGGAGAVATGAGEWSASNIFQRLNSLYESTVKSTLDSRNAIMESDRLPAGDLAYDINETVGSISFSFIEQERILDSDPRTPFPDCRFRRANGIRDAACGYY